MTRDDEREAVAGAARPGGPVGVRPAGQRGQLAVRDDLAAGHGAQRREDVPLERGCPVEVELDVVEGDALAAEVRPDALGEGMPHVFLRGRPGPRELVVKEPSAVEIQLPHAPSGHAVRHHVHTNRMPVVSAPGIFRVPPPVNEPVRDYAPGSPERASLQIRLEQMKGERAEIPCVIGGEDVTTGNLREAVMPHDKDHVLADVHMGGAPEVERAVKAAADAWEDWHRVPWEERAAVFLRAAELLAGPWRDTLNAATMLGQSKTALQAEIDAACELTDFWRFNPWLMTRMYEEQPMSAPGVWNRMEYRPLDGFVFAVSPFNFTAIGGNLPTAPALLGNTVVWKPAQSATYSNWFVFQLFREAGLPDGVINFVQGDPATVSDAVLAHPDLGGVHFTGSTQVFQLMWKKVGENIGHYRQYPRLVGETGGKDFVFVHPSASEDLEAVGVGPARRGL